ARRVQTDDRRSHRQRGGRHDPGTLSVAASCGGIGGRMGIRVALSAIGCVVLWLSNAAGQQTTLRKPDVFFVPTRPCVVMAMLDLASVIGKEVVYDLGCGAGRSRMSA